MIRMSFLIDDQFFSLLVFIYLACTLMCTHTHMCVCVCLWIYVWRSEDSLQELLFSFCPVGSKDQTCSQVREQVSLPAEPPL